MAEEVRSEGTHGRRHKERQKHEGVSRNGEPEGRGLVHIGTLRLLSCSERDNVLLRRQHRQEVRRHYSGLSGQSARSEKQRRQKGPRQVRDQQPEGVIDYS